MKLQIGMDSMLKLLREFINQIGFAVLSMCKVCKRTYFWSEYIDGMEMNSAITLFILLVFINLYHTLALSLLTVTVAYYMYVVVVTGRRANHLATPHPSLSFLP